MWLAVQVKFYTREGNWDLVGNNFPVCLPKLLHVVSVLYTPSYLFERSSAISGCRAPAPCCKGMCILL